MTTTVNTVSTTERVLHSMGLKMSSTLLREEAARITEQANSIEQQAAAITSNLSGIDDAIAAAQQRIAEAQTNAENAKAPVAAHTEAESIALSRVQAVQSEIARLQQQLVTETEAYATATGQRLDAIVTQSDEEVELAAARTQLSELNVRKANATSGLEVQISQLTLRASQLRTQAAAILSEAARIDAKRA